MYGSDGKNCILCPLESTTAEPGATSRGQCNGKRSFLSYGIGAFGIPAQFSQ